MKAIDQMVTNLGQLLMRPGGWILGKAVGFWQNAADLVTGYLKINPMSMSIDGGKTAFFKSAMGGIFNVMMAVGASLAVLYCMISFVNDSTDPKMGLTPQAALKYFARLSIVLGLLSLSTSAATDICTGVVSIVTGIAVDAAFVFARSQDVEMHMGQLLSQAAWSSSGRLAKKSKPVQASIWSTLTA